MFHTYASLAFGPGTITTSFDGEASAVDQIESNDKVSFFYPEFGGEFNVTKYFRLTLSAAYRSVVGSDKDKVSVSDSEMSGIDVLVGFRIGNFRI